MFRNIRNLLLIYFSLLTLSFRAFSQNRIQLRPSVGWGLRYYTHDKQQSQSEYNSNFILKFGEAEPFYYATKAGKVLNLLEGPQFGLMVEYNLSRHHVGGLGFMQGNTQSKMILYRNGAKGTDYFSTVTGGFYKKIGLEYTFKNDFASIFASKSAVLQRLEFSVLFGVFWVNNTRTNYSPAMTSLYVDTSGNTIDSFGTESFTMNDYS